MFPRPNLTCPCCGRTMAVTFGQKFLLCSTVFSPLRIFSQPDLYGEVFSCRGCAKNLETPGWVHWLPKIVSLAFPAALIHWLWASDNTSIFPAWEWSAILAILLILYPLFVVLTAWFYPLRCTGEPRCQHRHDFSGSDPLPRPALRQKPRSFLFASKFCAFYVRHSLASPAAQKEAVAIIWIAPIPAAAATHCCAAPRSPSAGSFMGRC